jgi:hypothetical protein
VADFFMRFSDGHEEVVDTKGMPDSVALLKRKMFWYHFPTVDYRWVVFSQIDGGWRSYEIVKKNRAERKKLKSKEKCN